MKRHFRQERNKNFRSVYFIVLLDGEIFKAGGFVFGYDLVESYIVELLRSGIAYFNALILKIVLKTEIV